MSFKEYESLRTFDVRSSTLIVTDPFCGVTGPEVQGCVPGRWEAFVRYTDKSDDGWGNRVAELVCWTVELPATWKRLGTVAVDAGTAGVYDAEAYARYDDGDGPACPKERGVPVSSGYGDGGYPVYVGKDDQGRVCGVKLLFVDLDHKAGATVRLVAKPPLQLPTVDAHAIACSECPGRGEECDICCGAHTVRIEAVNPPNVDPDEALDLVYGPTEAMALDKAREVCRREGWMWPVCPWCAGAGGNEGVCGVCNGTGDMLVRAPSPDGQDQGV